MHISLDRRAILVIFIVLGAKKAFTKPGRKHHLFNTARDFLLTVRCPWPAHTTLASWMCAGCPLAWLLGSDKRSIFPWVPFRSESRRQWTLKRIIFKGLWIHTPLVFFSKGKTCDSNKQDIESMITISLDKYWKIKYLLLNSLYYYISDFYLKCWPPRNNLVVLVKCSMNVNMIMLVEWIWFCMLSNVSSLEIMVLVSRLPTLVWVLQHIKKWI